MAATTNESHKDHIKRDSNVSLEIDYQTGPVTSLLFFSDSLILAGICGNLHIYDLQKSEDSAHVETNLLQKQNIHGIRKDNISGHVCVFGGKGIQFLSIHESDGYFKSVETLKAYSEFEDWIKDVCWLQDEKSSMLALALAHNVIVKWDCDTSTVLQTVHCADKYILYSAHFIGRTWNELILAAGTVFNQIVLWSPTGKTHSNGQREVIHKLVGHQGVIFSIHYLPDKCTIASASDDRSIRLWKLNFVKPPVSSSDWQSVTSECYKTLYGHSARVWSAQLLQEKIISIGEDATCCVWNYNGEIIQKFKGHQGKSIWSMSISPDNSRIVTGGGDYSIRLWSMNSEENLSSAHWSSHTLRFPSTLKIANSDIPRSVVLRNYREALIMTNEGALLQTDVTTNEWKLLYQNSTFKSYSLISVSPDQNLIAVGNISGDVLIRSSDKMICERVFEGKVFGLIWVSARHLVATGPDGNVMLVTIDCNENQVAFGNKVELTLPACKQRWVSAGQLVSHQQILICGDRGGTLHSYKLNQQPTPCQSFPKIHGKAGVTCVFAKDNNIYSAGRDGHYRIWSLNADGTLELHSCHKVLKGLEWIDRIQFDNSRLHVYGFHSTKFVIWSEEDNQLLYEVDCGGGHRSWDCRQHGELCRFLYIKNNDVLVHEGALQTNQQILKPGVHGREICDVKHITTVHRNLPHGKEFYHFVATASEDTTISISVIKAKGGLCKHQPLHSLQAHLSSVRTISINTVNSKNVDSRKEFVFFTGGGRAQLEVWRVTITECNEATKCSSANVNSSKHSSNDDDNDLAECQYEHLASVVLGEVTQKKGLKPWKKKHLNPDPETRILCLTSFCAADINVLYPSHLYFIGAACSDGLVRLFGFNARDKSLSLLDQSNYHNNCVIKIHHFIHQIADIASVFLVSGATEGNVVIWNIVNTCDSYVESLKNECEHNDSNNHTIRDSDMLNIDNDSDSSESSCNERPSKDFFPEKTKVIQVTSRESCKNDWQPCFKVKSHQSGINSIDVLLLDDNYLLVASGGDDNCLTVHKLLMTGQQTTTQFKVIHSYQLTTAHAAQITGLKILSSDKIVTVSVDQRMNIWRIEETSSDLKVVFCASQFINVSDIANLDVWKCGDKVFYSVCGEGLAYGHIS